MKKVRLRIILILFIIFLVFEGIGQNICGTSELNKVEIANIIKRVNSISNLNQTLNSNEIVWVPLAFRIFTEDNGNIGSKNLTTTQINKIVFYLNNRFWDSKIQFYLRHSGIYYHPNSQIYNQNFILAKNLPKPDITYIPTTYDFSDAINIFCVQKISGLTNSAYAYFPTEDNILETRVILNLELITNSDENFLMYTMAHEIGHTFNLHHTFAQNNSIELVSRGAITCPQIPSENCAGTGDFICDTQADPFNGSNTPPIGGVEVSLNPCSLVYSGNLVDPNNVAYLPPLNNLMSYYYSNPIPYTCNFFQFSCNQGFRIKEAAILRQQGTNTNFNHSPSPALGVPTSLIALKNGNSIALNWEENSNVEAGFIIERSLSPNLDFLPIAGINSNNTSYIDANLPQNITYYYRIRYSNSTNYSNVANSASNYVFPPSITTPNTTINTGDNIQLSTTGCNGGIIHWSNGMTGSNINVSPILLTGYTAYCQLNGYYSSPSNAVVITVNYQHHLSSAEFFIDQDPGIGRSLPLSLSFSGGLIDQTVPINLTSYQLPQGVHSIGIRVKDQNDKWSLTHTKTFLISGSSSGGSNSIADVEYFIDSLKQDKSNLISTGISAVNDATISIPIVQNIPQGVHSIAFRVKDNQGKYSLFHTKTYLVLGSEPGSNVLSKIEYFFDSDPGFGLGTQVNYTSVSGETQVIDINTNGLSSGVHVLNVRVKNAANQWSLTHAKVFLVMPDLGGTATVSKVEYFIDDNDPGPGVANNVAFTPNPDNKNVVANFDLDVNTYKPGIHRISARVLDSEGRWSPVVAKAFEFFPPISIVALSEINELSYTIPKESTIHHYYVAKTTNGDKPVPGVVINYQVGPDPTVRKSEPSDEDGIVDLNIKTGGDNLTSNIDDWIKVFNNPVPVQYIGIDKYSIVNSNQFFTNPFTVTLKEKAEPTEKVVEIGLGVSIKAAAADLEKYEKKSKVGNAEFAVGPKLGASIMLGPSLSYQQSETNPSVWHVKSRIGIGAEGEAGVEASIESGKFSAELNGSINAEIATTPGIYFDFNKDNARQVFELVKNIFLSNAFVPVGIYKAANFFRRASIDDYFPPSPLTFTGGSIGASLSGSINGEFGITYNAGTVANFPTYAKWLQAGGSLKLSGSRNMGVEIEAEKIKNEGRSLSIKTYSGVEMAEEYELLTNLTRRGALNWWKATLPFKSYSSSKQNANTLINYYSNDDDLLDTKVNQSSQKTISVNGLQTLNVTYNNITTFGPEARGRMLVAKDNVLLGNSIANFMFSNRPTYFNYVNNFVTGLPLQSFSQSFLDAKNYIINNFDPNWSLDQFSHEITRDYSIEQPALAVEIPKLASKVGEFKFNVANNYSFDLEKSKFSKTYKRIFPTISLADNESNLDLSFSNPVQELFTNLKTNTEALPQNLFDKFMDFVIPVKQYLNNFLVCVGNGGCPSGSNAIASGESKTGAVIRKDLNANVIYDGSANTKNTSSAQNTQPSLMNFTVEPSPQVFATGTELYFDYYYPENNLMAITASDTMRIVSDVFTLFANLNGTELNQAPNGNFTVNTTWNSNDLELAGMPQNLVPKIIFKPNGASTWQIIGDVNQTINFNQLGVFAFGVSLENDLVPPTIAVQAPSTFTQGQIMTINISDNLSGINWNNTSIFINGIAVAYTHTGSQIQLTLPASADNTYFVQVLTYDFSFNYKSYERVYPCAVSILIRSLEGRSDAPIIEKVSNFIEIDTQVPGGKDIILNAGKNIVFKPGFRIEAGQVMTAEVKGCEN